MVVSFLFAITVELKFFIYLQLNLCPHRTFRGFCLITAVCVWGEGGGGGGEGIRNHGGSVRKLYLVNNFSLSCLQALYNTPGCTLHLIFVIS